MLVPKRRAVERLASAKLVSAEGPDEEGRSGTSNSVSGGVDAGGVMHRLLRRGVRLLGMQQGVSC